MTTRTINSDNLQLLTGFLKAAGLPYEDIHPDGNLFFSYHNEKGIMIGCGGLELYGSSALLRSIAVASDERGKLIGKQIVSDLLEKAQQQSIKSVFLLTETAVGFFSKLAFDKIERQAVPPAVQQSTEFASVCPVSAICMRTMI